VNRPSLGRLGEKIALKALRQKGYKILGQNVRLPRGEIDVVAKDGRWIVFVEVKTRSQTHFGSPAEAVDPVKQRRLTRLAREWLQSQDLADQPARFDVVSILMDPAGKPRVEVFENAFEAAD